MPQETPEGSGGQAVEAQGTPTLQSHPIRRFVFVVVGEGLAGAAGGAFVAQKTNTPALFWVPAGFVYGAINGAAMSLT